MKKFSIKEMKETSTDLIILYNSFSLQQLNWCKRYVKGRILLNIKPSSLIVVQQNNTMA